MTMKAAIGATGGQETTPALTNILEQEIETACADVDRCTTQLNQTRRVRGHVATRIARFRIGLKQIEEEEVELAAKEEAELRLLTHRRKILFDIETEALN